MAFEIGPGTVAELAAEVSEGEIAGDASGQDGEEVSLGRDAEGPGGDDEKFHRHGDGGDGANENGEQAVVLEPFAELAAALADRVFFEILFAAFAGEIEEEHAAGDRADGGEGRGEIGGAGRVRGQQHEEGVDGGGDGDTGRIEGGEEEETGRAPGDEGGDEILQASSLASMGNRSASERILMPSSVAFSSLEPASSPATT